MTIDSWLAPADLEISKTALAKTKIVGNLQWVTPPQIRTCQPHYKNLILIS